MFAYSFHGFVDRRSIVSGVEVYVAKSGVKEGLV